MSKLSRRDAERRLRAFEVQRDQALKLMRLWIYLALAAVLTLLFTRLLWGLLYVVLFVIWMIVTSVALRRAAAETAK